MSDAEADNLKRRLMRILFAGPYGTTDHTMFTKVLWRMSSGSRKKAIEISKKTLEHYDFPKDIDDQDFEYIFDCACAEAVDGTEIEWLSE